MKLITRNTDYALRAICFVVNQEGRVVTAGELVKKLRIPRPFLRKILQSLNREGILVSTKGSGGGFYLAKPAKEIDLLELIGIFQGHLTLNECLFKKLACPNVKTCKLKKRIDKIETMVLRELAKINVASLLSEERLNVKKKDHQDRSG
ncbi:MAG: Rrf2 family transcriptional regulator [Candidatus Omnitrophica bacterium]|nr:Rrf2 family transcriptional regulator [Candidatus Omnitrophota bacterium]MDD5512984.1 Rrf2 family transcriptional regulator [Candidatus Omnitrophota bacterium]